MLGGFQNSSVPVLNFAKYMVPVPTGSTKNLYFCPGSDNFGSTVLTVPNF